MTGPRVPELQPQPQGDDLIPDQLETGDLEAVHQHLVDRREPRQENVAGAERGADPPQPLTLEDAVAAEAREEIRVFGAQPLFVSALTISDGAAPRIGGDASDRARTRDWDMAGPNPWSAGGARTPSVATGSADRAATFTDADRGVEVVCVSHV